MKFKSVVSIRRGRGRKVFGYLIRIYPWARDYLTSIVISKYRSVNTGAWCKADVSWPSSGVLSPDKAARFDAALQVAISFARQLDYNVMEGNLMTEKLIRQRLAYSSP